MIEKRPLISPPSTDREGRCCGCRKQVEDRQKQVSACQPQVRARQAEVSPSQTPPQRRKRRLAAASIIVCRQESAGRHQGASAGHASGTDRAPVWPERPAGSSCRSCWQQAQTSQKARHPLLPRSRCERQWLRCRSRRRGPHRYPGQRRRPAGRLMIEADPVAPEVGCRLDIIKGACIGNAGFQPRARP